MHGEDTTSAAIEARAMDSDPDVRAAVAAAAIVAESYAAMRMLANDPDPEVREVLRCNPAVPAVYWVPAFRGHPALLPERVPASVIPRRR
jgi:hypothetical protein